MGSYKLSKYIFLFSILLFSTIFLISCKEKSELSNQESIEEEANKNLLSDKPIELNDLNNENKEEFKKDEKLSTEIIDDKKEELVDKNTTEPKEKVVDKKSEEIDKNTTELKEKVADKKSEEIDKNIVGKNNEATDKKNNELETKLTNENKKEVPILRGEIVARSTKNVEDGMSEDIEEVNEEKTEVLEGIIITIDAGHQLKGNSTHEKIAPNSVETKPKVSSGTSGVSTGKKEYELTLEMALKLEKELKNQGATVVMIRTTNDVDISNSERALIANKNNSNVAIRLHADGSTDSSVKGFSLLVPGNEYIKDENIISVSNNIATKINENMKKTTEGKSRGVITRNDLTGFNWLTVPSVLIEMGFMSNPEEDKLLSDEEYQNKIIKGTVDGLLEYYAQ